MNDPQRLLRNSLRGNAAFSTLSGLTFAVGASTLAPPIGLADPRILMSIGVGLLGFAGYLAFVASRPELPVPTALQIVWADLAWVLITIPLALTVLNFTGILATLAIADVVLLFAILQYVGVRRIRNGASVPVAS